MAHTKGVSEGEATWSARLIYRWTRGRLGKVPQTFQVSALSPWVLRGMAAFQYCFGRFRLVNPRLVALAELKAALMIGCPFCIDIISALSKAKGVPDAQRLDLIRYQESDAYSPLEKKVIEYAELLSTTPVEVPDALHEELRKHFSPAQLVELTSAIAWENYRARFNHALGMESEGFAAGAACALPTANATRRQPTPS